MAVNHFRNRVISQSGYTLVEVLLAIALILSFVTPLIEWIDRSQIMESDRRFNLHARQALQRSIAEFRAYRTNEILAKLAGSDQFCEDLYGYSLVWQAIASDVSLYQLRLTLYWLDYRGSTKEHAVTLVVAQAK